MVFFDNIINFFRVIKAINKGAQIEEAQLNERNNRLTKNRNWWRERTHAIGRRLLAIVGPALRLVATSLASRKMDSSNLDSIVIII